MLRITIEGNIGSGKSSLMKALSMRYPCRSYCESIEKWTNVRQFNLLSAFYQNPVAYTFDLQTLILTTTAQSYIEPIEKLTFYERSIHSAYYVFARLNSDKMSNYQCAILDQQYLLLSKLVPKSDLVIFLRNCSPLEALERIVNRERAGESQIDISYLTNLQKQYDEYFLKKDFNCIVINEKLPIQKLTELVWHKIVTYFDLKFD